MHGNFYFYISSGLLFVLRRYFLCFMAASSPIVRLTRQTFSVYCLIHPHFRTSLLTHTHAHTRIGGGFPDLADDHRLISAAWAVAAHEPWCAVHYLFTDNSYSGPWDSELRLSASELFGQAGYVLDCATQPPLFNWGFKCTQGAALQ